MTRLDDLLTKQGFSKKTSKSNIDFPIIEEHLRFKLPEDYKYYLANYDDFEGFVGEEYLRLWKIDDLFKLNKEYGVNDLPDTIAIGTNGNMEFIAIELKVNDYRIVLSPFIDIDVQNHIEIGTSFSDMLIRLKNGIKWFN